MPKTKAQQLRALSKINSPKQRNRDKNLNFRGKFQLFNSLTISKMNGMMTAINQPTPCRMISSSSMPIAFNTLVEKCNRTILNRFPSNYQWIVLPLLLNYNWSYRSILNFKIALFPSLWSTSSITSWIDLFIFEIIWNGFTMECHNSLCLIWSMPSET